MSRSAAQAHGKWTACAWQERERKRGLGAHRVEHVAVLAEQRDDVGAGRELLERAVVRRKQCELNRGVRELVDELGRNDELGEG